MSEENLLRIDVEKRTTRGRACPRCGGKIIPSNRAVYQASDPEDSFPIWQCERCGYEEMTAKKVAAPKKGATATSSSAQVAKVAPKPKPMLDAKGRALPADVRAIMHMMGQTDGKDV